MHKEIKQYATRWCSRYWCSDVNLTKYSDKYSKTSGNFLNYYIDEAALDDNNTITDFNADNATTSSFKIKEKNRIKQAKMAQKILK